MRLILSNAEAEQLLTMPGAIAALEALYRDLGTGSAINRPRTDFLTPTRAEAGATMPAAHQ